MKFRALVDQTDGSGLGRGEVLPSTSCRILGACFAMQKSGRALTAQDSLVVSAWWVFVPPSHCPDSQFKCTLLP